MKVYISPSTQESNKGVTPFGTEEAEMNLIADKLMPLLFQDGRFVTARNTPDMSIYQAAKQSNDFNADIHVAIHSNAGGGEGTEVFAYSAGSNSEKLAKALYNQIAPLSPGSDRGVKYKPALVEVGDAVNATACLIELAYHDNAKEAVWMAYNHITIANALYKGICDYFGYDYKALVSAVPPTPVVAPVVTEDKDIYLSVRVLQSKSDALVKQIQSMGFACKVLPLA